MWEYKTININALDGDYVLSDGLDIAKFDKKLNELGLDKWELVAIDNQLGVAIFKRERRTAPGDPGRSS
jgi:hypothetical protein